jgi:hypothetical protein
MGKQHKPRSQADIVEHRFDQNASEQIQCTSKIGYVKPVDKIKPDVLFKFAKSQDPSMFKILFQSDVGTEFIQHYFRQFLGWIAANQLNNPLVDQILYEKVQASYLQAKELEHDKKDLVRQRAMRTACHHKNYHLPVAHGLFISKVSQKGFTASNNVKFKFDAEVLHHEEDCHVFNFTKSCWTPKDDIANVTIMVSARDVSRELRKAFQSQSCIVAEVFRYAGMCELLAEPSRGRGKTPEIREKNHSFQIEARVRMNALWNQ